MKLTGLYYEEETGHYLKGYKTGNPSDAEELGTSLAKELQERCKVEYKESGLQEDNKKEPGKVWLVGAGPGDVGLFTMKGAQVLEQADVVVYDSLVGQGILTRIPASAKLINVGKRAGHHTMSQEKINQVLAEEAKKGNKVVRLKGGDPFLFGRGGEELELLTKEGIPYEIVPGVTSPISVPAYNGIPVTHRDFCSSVHVITGHKRKGMEYDIDFGALVHTKGTLVFLMGITAMEDICNGLMKAGMEPDMPAAVLSKGTTAGQKRVVATVGTLKAAADQAKIQTPAIIVVGQVCQVAALWQMILPGMRNYLWQAGRSLSPGQRRIFPELRPFFGRKVQKYWNFHPSVLSLWRIRADCTRPFLISAAMTGWYLQVLQAWKFSSGKWRKRRSTCVLLEMQKSR